MDAIFIVILLFLALLAAFDLFVGVSNDAVNFLNSAVGSRIAPFKVVMIVASVGVLVGATFSSGMMEIARSGVFNPWMFTFAEIIVIFFAVMIADVLLLDIFNSFGLPTSTTVSIVFELLGGAVAAAAFKIFSSADLTLVSIGNYINSEKAFVIVSGILISVVVAFTAGVIVQYITRLIFTFKYERIYRYVGSSFGAIAITSIIYFLVMKGAGGASFMKPEFIAWINEHTGSILLWTFLSLALLFQLLITFFHVNIFKPVILSGTFALAFAFAGNDLVNFVGVPLAALDSYNNYQASGMAADAFTMESLKNAVHTPTGYLLLAGMIMVLTLLFSRKAQRVVQTSINLSSSSRGAKEQFGSSMLGRGIVRSSLKLGKMFHQFVPEALSNVVSSRMEQPQRKKGEVALPFDYVRASINLVVSSILIASATSLKLPLSTTYVTFMVAMGSSLADGAWDRESAVYRISGVMTVIGGWFFTAFSAFLLCAVVTFAVLYGGIYAVVGMMLLVSILLIRSNFLSKRSDDKAVDLMGKSDRMAITKDIICSTDHYLTTAIDLYKRSIAHFLDEEMKPLKKVRNEAINIQEEIALRRAEYYRLALDGSESKADGDARHYYYRVFTNLKEVGHGLRSVIGTAYNHIDNNHRVYQGVLRTNLTRMIVDLEELKGHLDRYIEEGDQAALASRCSQSIELINALQRELLQRIDEDNLSLRGSELYLNFLQFSRDLVNRFSLIALLNRELKETCLPPSVNHCRRSCSETS